MRQNRSSNNNFFGSGCGSVGSQRFESSHWLTFISDIYLFTDNCIEKSKIKKKEAENGPLKRKKNFLKDPLSHSSFLILNEVDGKLIIKFGNNWFLSVDL